MIRPREQTGPVDESAAREELADGSALPGFVAAGPSARTGVEYLAALAVEGDVRSHARYIHAREMRAPSDFCNHRL